MKQSHIHGHTNVYYHDDGKFFSSSGADGEVKIFNGIDDKDPIIHKIGDLIFAHAIKNNRLYVSNDMNAIQRYTIVDGMNDGIMLRFSAPSHHFIFNKLGSILIAGSSDLTLKSLNLETKIQRLYEGHTAPVLSVALHSNENIIASSSCDGNVRIWDFYSQNCLKVLNCLPTSNCFENSKTLAQISFCNSIKALLIPCEKSVKFYSVESWNAVLEIKKPFLDQVVTMISVSQNEQFFVSATNDYLFVFDVKTNKIIKSEKIYSIVTCVSWHPQSTRFVFSNKLGQINLTSLETIIDSPNIKFQQNPYLMNDFHDSDLSNVNNVYKDHNDHKSSYCQLNIGGKNDELDYSGIPGYDTDGEEGGTIELRPGGKKDPPMIFNEDKSYDKVHHDDIEILPSFINQRSFLEPTQMQAPFQPSATPISFSRFMLWNDIGKIIQYDSEDEQTINVEFHDSSMHHTININNSVHNYTIAALNSCALVLSNTSSNEAPCKLFCMYFSSWDLSKDWCLTFPNMENITGITIGDKWIAVATSAYNIRFFSFGGLQREIISIAGPIVCISSHSEKLIVVFHNSLAILGDQCLSFDFFSISKKKKIYSDRLPLSPKSSLKWIGFSNVGTPFTVDSSGIVRIHNNSFANTWSCVANLNDYVKSPCDNFWVVSISEEPQQIRAIFCKSSKYPMVLPPPVIQILPFKIAVCEPATEKSILEENYLRSIIFHNCNIDNIQFNKNEKEIVQQEYLMKLFALACRNKRIYRAFEIAEMLTTSHTVQLASKYAIQKGELHLANKLENLATSKKKMEDMEDFESRSNNQSDLENLSIDFTISNHTSNNSDLKNDLLMEEININPIIQWQSQDENSITVSNVPISSSQTSKLIKNPFRILSSCVKQPTHVGSILFDAIEIQKKTTNAQSEDMKPKKILGQQKLSPSLNYNNCNDGNKSLNEFDIWYEKNKEHIMELYPKISHEDLVIVAAKTFKSLSKHVIKENDYRWNSHLESTEDKKRKLKEENQNLNKKLKSI